MGNQRLIDINSPRGLAHQPQYQQPVPPFFFPGVELEVRSLDDESEHEALKTLHHPVRYNLSNELPPMLVMPDIRLG